MYAHIHNTDTRYLINVVCICLQNIRQCQVFACSLPVVIIFTLGTYIML